MDRSIDSYVESLARLPGGLAPVATRTYGMRDFVLSDPDGHQYRLGCGTEKLRDVAGQYGLPAEVITVEPEFLDERKRRP